MPYTLTDEQLKCAQTFVQSVLDKKEPARLSQMNMSDSAERIITDRLRGMLYEPLLPFGDYQARKNIKLLEKLISKKKLPVKWHEMACTAIHAWEGVRDWYYSCKPMTPKSNRDAYPELKELIRQSEDNQDWDLRQFAKLMLEGMPVGVANFHIEPLFLLVKVDGKRDRMLRIHNANQEDVGIVALDSESFSQPNKLRVWLSDQGNLVWMSRESELNKLQADIAHRLSKLEVHQVPAFGWHEQSGLWFFGDCAVDQGGILLPDNDRVIWKNEKGYTILDRGGDNQVWRLPKPMMRPDIGGVRIVSGDTPKTPPNFEAAPKRNAEALTAFFREFSNRMRLSLKTEQWLGYDAFSLIGGILAFAAAPEVFARHKMSLGMWIHGQTHTGKSTLASWLVEIFGFNGMSEGLGLQKNVTAVGIQIAAEQFSNLPVWLGEFDNNRVDDDKLAIIHAAFNRELASKYSLDGKMRKLRTNFIVTGEHTSTKASTRARYVHFLTGKNDWSNDNQLAWMEQHRSLFFLFGREVLERRKDYVDHFTKAYNSWNANPALSDVLERERLIHGIAYSGFFAMMALLETHGAEEMNEFRTFAIRHSMEAVEHITDEVNLNKFWDDMMTAYRGGKLSLWHFKAKRLGNSFTPSAPSQEEWLSYHLYMEPKGICAEMRTYLRLQGRSMPLEPSDLRDQMSKDAHGYWISGPNKQRLGENSTSLNCYCIDLDKHPQGYQHVSDDELQKARDHAFKDGDPRKGPLFEIVQALEKQSAKPIKRCAQHRDKRNA